MIQELKIRNFLSFKEEVTFSFEATKDTTYEDYQVVTVAPDVRLLRFAIIYGANASGKSNLLSTLEFLHDFWFDIKKDVTEKTEVVPFKLDQLTPTQPSGFSLKFYVKGMKYWYTVELDEKKVISEKLYFYNSVQPTLLFDRELKNNISVITFNSSVVKISAMAKEEINIKCLPNTSFFASRNQVNVSLPIIDDARDWMKENILPAVSPKMDLFNYAERKIQEDDELKKHLLEFIQEADFNITGIETKVIKKEVPKEFLEFILKSDDIQDDEKEKLRQEKSFTHLKTNFEHTVKNERGIETYYLAKKSQSEGTRQITGLESIIYSGLQRESMIMIDEIESSLHPNLIMFILKKFLEKKDNQAQLLITTHYDPLLNEVGDLFRKDSFWFTEKNESGATELYSLVEFTGLNRIASLQKAYRSGRFGGIPKINL